MGEIGGKEDGKSHVWLLVGSSLVCQLGRQDLQDELHRKFNVADFLECACSSEVLQK